jgi:hypothetical protein
MNFKKSGLILIVVLTTVSLFGKETHSGIKFYAGGRYDNLRMCVGSPVGVKGGPIADISFLLKKKLSDRVDTTFNLPVMRPALFGVAFQMVQFEPDVTFEFGFPLTNGKKFIIGPAVGVSVHWGPDYNSGTGDERTKDFFAMGPHVSALFAMSFPLKSGKVLTAGTRLFQTTHFSNERDPGVTLGAAVDISIFF